MYYKIFLCHAVVESDLREFVEAEGGQWQENPTPQGVFVDGEVFIFIRGIDRQQAALAQYTAADLARITQATNAPIRGYLEIAHSRGNRGSELAKKLIDKLIARWGAHHCDGGG